MRHIELRIWWYRLLRSRFPRWAGRRLVGWLLVKANRLSVRGFGEAAVNVAREAVDAGVEVARTHPQLYGSALDALASGLLRQGRVDEAALVVERIAALADEVAAVDVAVGDRMKGSVLLARCHLRQAQGLADEALAAAVQAAALFRAQVSSRRRGRRRDWVLLAAALGRLGHRYTERGRHQDAVLAHQEALNLYMRLPFWHR